MQQETTSRPQGFASKAVSAFKQLLALIAAPAASISVLDDSQAYYAKKQHVATVTAVMNHSGDPAK